MFFSNGKSRRVSSKVSRCPMLLQCTSQGFYQADMAKPVPRDRMVMGCSSGLSSAGLGTILVYVVSSSNGLMQIQQGYSSPRSREVNLVS